MTQHCLYRFYDAKARLLYIGITKDPENRFRNHRQQKQWWMKVTAITIDRYSTRRELMEAEIAAIQSEKPRYNVAYSTTGEVQQIRMHDVNGHSLWPDASRFCTTYEPREYLEPRIRLSTSCPVCFSLTVFKESDEYGKPVDDLIRCSTCLNVWLDEEWDTLIYGPVFDMSRDMSHDRGEQVSLEHGSTPARRPH